MSYYFFYLYCQLPWLLNFLVSGYLYTFKNEDPEELLFVWIMCIYCIGE